MKKLALVAISLFVITSGQANASPIEDVSAAVVTAVSTELSQVTSSIQTQVQQSINESVEAFFTEKAQSLDSAEATAESEE